MIKGGMMTITHSFYFSNNKLSSGVLTNTGCLGLNV